MMLLWCQPAVPDPLLQVSLFQHNGTAPLTSTPSNLLPSKAKEDYRVCAVIPSSRDTYWDLVVDGLNYQASRAGVTVDVFETEEYYAVSQQRNILQLRCLDNGYNAILLGALSENGLDDLIGFAMRRGVPVIDLVNGVSSTDVSGRALVPFELMGEAAANTLASLGAARGSRILWFPGPKGPRWSDRADGAFQRIAAKLGFEILSVDYSPPFFRDQEIALRRHLETFDRVDFIVGTAPTAEAAARMKQVGDRSISVVAYYYAPSIRDSLSNGQVKAAVYDDPWSQARIAVDMAVKTLNNESFPPNVGPNIRILRAENLSSILPH